MADQTIRLGPEYFPDPLTGRPIAGGSIYVGIPDLNPEVEINQKQISVLQENGSTVPVDQPLSTSAGGMPIYNGSTVTIKVDGQYSLKILDSLGSQKYYIPTAGESAGVSNTIGKFEDLLSLINVTSPDDDDAYTVLSFFDGLNSGGGTFYWDSTTDKATANGGTIIDPDNIGGFDGTFSTIDAFLAAQGGGVGFGCWLRIHDTPVAISWFGARSGLAYDNTDIVQAVHDSLPNSGGEIYIPSVKVAEPFTDDSVFWCAGELVFTKGITLSGVDFTASSLGYLGASLFITAPVEGLVLHKVAITGTEGVGGEVYNPGSVGIKSAGVIYSILSKIVRFEHLTDYNGGFYHHFEACQMGRCKIMFNDFNANNLTIIGGKYFHCETVFSCNGGAGPLTLTGVAFEFIQSRIAAATSGANFDINMTGCYLENRPDTLTEKGIGGDLDNYDSCQAFTNGTGKITMLGNLINTRGFTRIVNQSGEATSDVVSLGNHFILGTGVNATLDFAFVLGTLSNLVASDSMTGTVGASLYTSIRPTTGFASDPFLGTPIEFFESDADWTTPGALLNGWTNDGSVGAAEFGYYKDDQGVVYLRGRVDGGSSTSVTIASLPVEYRPPDHVYVPAITTANASVLVRITTDGNVNVELPATPTNVSLDGISYKL